MLFEASLTVNGVPETTASVVVTTPSGPVTVPYLGNSNGMAVYYLANSSSYQFNGIYQMAVSTSLGTATSASVSAPGNITGNAGSTSVTWTYEGNADGIVVVQQTGGPVTTYNSYTSIGPDIDSPANLSSAYPVSTGSTSYTLQIYTANKVSFSGSNVASASAFTLEEYDSVGVTK